MESMDGTGLRLGFVLAKASKGEMESKNDLLGGTAADCAGKENGGAGSGPSKLPSCSFCTGGDTLITSLALLSCELKGEMLASLEAESQTFEAGYTGTSTTSWENDWNPKTQ